MNCRLWTAVLFSTAVGLAGADEPKGNSKPNDLTVPFIVKLRVGTTIGFVASVLDITEFRDVAPPAEKPAIPKASNRAGPRTRCICKLRGPPSGDYRRWHGYPLRPSY